MKLRIIRVVLVAAVLFGFFRAIPRCEGQTQQIIGEHQRDASVLEELKKPSTVEFYETPIEDVLEFISQRHDIPVWLDRNALSTLGLDEGLPISLEMDGGELGTILKFILREHDLTYLVRDGILVITSEEEECANLILATYDVRKLLHPKQPQESIDALIQTITATVESDSWAECGGPGMISHYRGLIVVDQTMSAHGKIAALLQQMAKSLEQGDQLVVGFDKDEEDPFGP